VSEVYYADTLEGAVSTARAVLSGRHDGTAPAEIPESQLTPFGREMHELARSGSLGPGVFLVEPGKAPRRLDK